MEEDYLLISDDGPGFHTLEGEGRYLGYPSVFMRLFGCNLTCKGWASKDSPYGCDSYVSWSKKHKYTFTELFEFYDKNGFIENLRRGDIWKITGGEPMLRQKPLLNFIKAFVNRYHFTPKIDIETNGTLLPEKEWDSYNTTYTVSPKLSSNGDSERLTYKPQVLNFHIEKKSCFKFVVKNETDLEELKYKYINSSLVSIPRENIWLMVCAGSREEHINVAESIADLCKKEGYKLSPRLHLLIWDKALKV